MPTSSDPSFNMPGSVVVRWAFRGFILGLYLGVAIGISVFVK